MDTVFELLAAINSAIDAGVMTQEVIAFAALAIRHSVLDRWKAGEISPLELHRVSVEMEHLRRRWRASRCKGGNASDIAAFAVPLEQDLRSKFRTTL